MSWTCSNRWTSLEKPTRKRPGPRGTSPPFRPSFCINWCIEFGLGFIFFLHFLLKGGYFFFFVLKVGKKGNLRNEKDLGKKKKWTGGLVADWRTSSSHLESISANEMADQDNEPNAGMLTIESALSQLGMNERIWIFKNNFTFPQIDHWR